MEAQKEMREIRHPNDDPNRQRFLSVAKRRVETGQVKFESEGQRMDYERRVNSNPNNIYGLPEFFPPEVLRSALAGVQSAIECECGGCCVAKDGYICPRCGKKN
jgi:hypothetical protein